MDLLDSLIFNRVDYSLVSNEEEHKETHGHGKGSHIPGPLPGSHHGGHSEEASKEPTTEDKSDSSLERSGTALTKLIGGSKAIYQGTKDALTKVGKGVWDRLPSKVQGALGVLHGAYHWVENQLEKPYIAAQKVTKEAMKQRGLPDTHIEKISRIIAGADYISRWTGNIPGAHAAIHALEIASGGLGIALSKVGFYVPIGSLAYLAYSTARNPLATYRAAKNLITGKLGPLSHPHAEHAPVHNSYLDLIFNSDEVSPDIIVRLNDSIEHAPDPELFQALVMIAMDEIKSRDMYDGTSNDLLDKACYIAHEISQEDKDENYPKSHPPVMNRVQFIVNEHKQYVINFANPDIPSKQPGHIPHGHGKGSGIPGPLPGQAVKGVTQSKALKAGDKVWHNGEEHSVTKPGGPRNSNMIEIQSKDGTKKVIKNPYLKDGSLGAEGSTGTTSSVRGDNHKVGDIVEFGGENHLVTKAASGGKDTFIYIKDKNGSTRAVQAKDLNKFGKEDDDNPHIAQANRINSNAPLAHLVGYHAPTPSNYLDLPTAQAAKQQDTIDRENPKVKYTREHPNQPVPQVGQPTKADEPTPAQPNQYPIKPPPQVPELPTTAKPNIPRPGIAPIQQPSTPTKPRQLPTETKQGEQHGPPEPGRGDRRTSLPVIDGHATASGPMAGSPIQPSSQAASEGRNNASKSASEGSTKLTPANIEEVNRRIDRFTNFFRNKGQHEVAGWLDKLKAHVNDVGVGAALEGLGHNPGGKGEKVKYGGAFDELPHFVNAYLNRFGISVNQNNEHHERRMISSVAPTPEGEEGLVHRRHDREDDILPSNPTLKDKLDEAKHLPGLEKSEDIHKISGKDVTHFTPDVMKKLDERFGKNGWIVKSYGDEAFAGYGVFFPQRVEAIQKDAQSTVHGAGQELAKYGFKYSRDHTGKITGIEHEGGDKYEFGSEKYNNTIFGDVRHAADSVSQDKIVRDKDGTPRNMGKPIDNEHATKLPEGSFMGQPAFPVVGVSDADRAAGKTHEGTGEGRVHIVTRDGVASIIPHSTWIKGEHLPVVIENEHTRDMARAALDAINALPASERQGQMYAPDVVRTAQGHKVVEANPHNEAGGSGWMGDNPMIIDSCVAHLTGREPAHVAFVRKLLEGSKNGQDTTGKDKGSRGEGSTVREGGSGEHDTPTKGTTSKTESEAKLAEGINNKRAAQETLLQAQQNVSKHGFDIIYDDHDKAIGIEHQNGDKYEFGTKKYNDTIFGDVRHWGDKAATAAHHAQAPIPGATYDGGDKKLLQDHAKAPEALSKALEDAGVGHEPIGSHAEHNDKVLEAAKKSGNYIPPEKLPFLASDKENIGGFEHDVYHDPQEGKFYKLTANGKFGHGGGSVHDYLKRNEIANSLWPSLNHQMHGITEDHQGRPQTVMSMNQISGTVPEQHEINSWFRDKGWQPSGWDGERTEDNIRSWHDPVSGTTIHDTHGGNFMKTKAGLVPIDVDIVPGHSMPKMDKQTHNYRPDRLSRLGLIVNELEIAVQVDDGLSTTSSSRVIFNADEYERQYLSFLQSTLHSNTKEGSNYHNRTTQSKKNIVTNMPIDPNHQTHGHGKGSGIPGPLPSGNTSIEHKEGDGHNYAQSVDDGLKNRSLPSIQPSRSTLELDSEGRFMAKGKMGDRVKAYTGANDIHTKMLEHNDGISKLTSDLENKQNNHDLITANLAKAEYIRSTATTKELPQAKANLYQAIEAHRRSSEELDTIKALHKEATNKAVHELVQHLKPSSDKQVSIDIDSADNLGEQQKSRFDSAHKFLTDIFTKGSTDELIPLNHDKIDPSEGRRTHYDSGDGRNGNPTIRSTDEDHTSTHLHELGHYLQEFSEGLGKAAFKFTAYRCGDEKPQKLSELFPNSGFMDHEQGRKDNFEALFGQGSHNAYYAGRVYGTNNTEMFSMGLEHLFNNPANMAQKDPEYFKFMIGALKGHLR